MEEKPTQRAIFDVIRSSEFDPEFARVVASSGADEIVQCFQCGTCTGSCPMGRVSAIRTRQLIRMAVLGLKNVLATDELWHCTTCGTCYDRCPRDLKVTEAIVVMRMLAVREGHIPPNLARIVGYVYQYGHAVPINEEIRNLRKKLGLSELPPTTHSYPQALESVQKAMRATSIYETVVERGKPDRG